MVLFGSAARHESRPDSDVDLFIDTRDPSLLEPKAESILADFESSVKVREYWRLLGVRQSIRLRVGDASELECLSPALLEDGIVLYGRHRPTTPETSPRALVSWENIRSGKTRTNIYRNLFGYVARGQRYPGLLERLGGERLFKGSILIPLEALPIFRELFTKHQVTCQLRVVYESPAPSSTSQVDPLEQRPSERPVHRPLAVPSGPPENIPQPLSPEPTAKKAAAQAPARKRKKRRSFYGQGYCELCASSWPEGWQPTLEQRGVFRCFGCDQELDVGLRVPPMRSDTPFVPRPSSYTRPSPPPRRPR